MEKSNKHAKSNSVEKMSVLNVIQHCPVEVAMHLLGKKWTIHVIRDMFRGTTKFSDFLKLNPKMSTRVLSQRLKELVDNGLIERIVLAQTPVNIEYHLTDRGLALNPLINELSKFSITEYPERIFAEVVEITPQTTEQAIEEANRRFSVIASITDYETAST